MNRPRSPTKSAVLWQVIIARFYRKIYHYFANSTQPVGRANLPDSVNEQTPPRISLHVLSVSFQYPFCLSTRFTNGSPLT